jgi:hypothetical protein
VKTAINNDRKADMQLRQFYTKKILFILLSLLIIVTLIKLHSVDTFSQLSDRNNRQLQLIDNKMKSFSFAVFGDNRNSMDTFPSLINVINADGDNMFSIDIGDLVGNGEKRKYMLFLDQTKRFQKPFLTAIGNHDIENFGTEENGRENYHSLFGKFYYSFAVGDTYFILLDNANQYNVDTQQMEWLKEQLEKSLAYTNRFVFMHVPLFDPRVKASDIGHAMRDRKFAEELNAMFDRYHVAMLFASHIHAYYRGVWGNTPYIITGGAGAPLYGTDSEHSYYHYIKVRVNEKGTAYEVKKIPPAHFNSVDLFITTMRDAWRYIYYFFVFHYFTIILSILVLYGIIFLLNRRDDISRG